MSDRMPPQNIEAERSVLGAILLNPKQSIPRVVGVLSGILGDCFYTPAHQYVFNGLLSLNDSGTPIDAITLQDQLDKDGTLEDVGGLAYITDLTGAVPTSYNAESYAGLVEESARKRKMLQVFRLGINDIWDNEADDVSAAVRMGLIDCEPKSRKGLTLIEDKIPDVMEVLESYIDTENPISHVRTGIRSLDNILVSMRSDNLYIFAARPAVGKSAVALNIAVNVAARQGIPVLFFSLEMSIEVCLERVIGIVGEVDIHSYKRGASGNGVLSDIGVASKKVKGMPLWVNDTANIVIDEMFSVIRLHVEKHGSPGLIIVDYLQLMTTGGSFKNMSRRDDVAKASLALKAVSREFHCPVLALSQLARAAEDSKDGPKLIHLSESGTIENDASVVVLMSKPSADFKSNDSRLRLKLDVAKNRHGAPGIVEVLFVQAHQIVRDIKIRHTAQKEEEDPGDVQEDLY